MSSLYSLYINVLVLNEKFQEGNAHTWPNHDTTVLLTGAHFHPHLGDTHIRISGFGANHQPTRMGVSLLRVIYAERHYILLPFCPL